jgi:NAD(P)-dependent dehydrogenase (short-subunit alcohol dehydrogenase family)
MRLANKVSIITGAGDGIGQAAAVMFAEEGSSVVIADISVEKANNTLSMIKAKNGKGMVVQVDVRKADSVEKMVKDVMSAYGKIDILVNNAAVFIEATVLTTPEDEWDRIMDINLKGIFLCSKFVIPVMIKAGKGSIVNIGSEAGITGFKNQTAYDASKGGVVNMTRAMALDFAEKNIRVNCICPGTTETPMVKQAIAVAPDPVQARRNFSSRPLLRLGRPEEIAAGILYIASDESEFATGAIIAIDGGKTAGGFNA